MAPLVWARNTTKTATKNLGVSTVPVSRARRAGEHRLPACSIRPPAECPATLAREVAHAVRGKLLRITGRRAVLPIRQRNCLWPSLAPRPPSARFLSRFRVRARLVEDRKMHCALLRQRSAAPLLRHPLLPRAARVSPAFDLWSQTRRRCSTSRLSLPHPHS